MTLLFSTQIFGQTGIGVYSIGFFVLWWFYPVGFEVLHHGVTPGKAALGLQVVHDDGTPIGWSSSLLRNLLQFADFLPIAFGFGLLSMLLNTDFKRLGDLAAGTVVIYRDRQIVGQQVPRAGPVPPPIPLNREEQRVVIDFGGRLVTWNQARAEELADIAAPLTGTTGPKGMQRLLGMANWLLGRQGGEA